MLSEALLKTFLGKYFYFGFKLTGSTNVEESPSLRHVLKSDNSQYGSQLDYSSNFENSHTLAYQMLACSDAVSATVTDHMRLSVKLLRNHNQSEHIKTPHLKEKVNNQSAVITENLSASSLSRMTPGSLGSCKTVSSDLDQESVMFSFETSLDQTCSPQEIDKGTESMITGRSINLAIKTLHDISFVKPQADVEKEHFLATNVINDAHSLDWRSCVSLDTFNEDAVDSSITVNDGHNKVHSLLTEFDMRNQSSKNACPFSKDYASMFGNIFSQIPVTTKLELDNLSETVTGVSNTSRRIDEELKRRELILSWKTTCSSHVDGSGMIPHCIENRREAKVVRTSTTVAILEGSSTMNCNGEHGFMINEMTKTCDKVLDIDFERRPAGNIISELNMPESEDLNAFFDSQFDGIVFTQEAASTEINIANNTLRQDRELRILKKCEYEKKAAGLSTIDAIETSKNRIIKTENATTMENMIYNLPESEGLENYFDSFDHCSILNVTATQQLEIGCVVQVPPVRAVSQSPSVCKDSTDSNGLSLDRGSIHLSYAEECESAVKDINLPNQQAVNDFKSRPCNISTTCRDIMNTCDDIYCEHMKTGEELEVDVVHNFVIDRRLDFDERDKFLHVATLPVSPDQTCSIREHDEIDRNIDSEEIKVNTIGSMCPLDDSWDDSNKYVVSWKESIQDESDYRHIASDYICTKSGVTDNDKNDSKVAGMETDDFEKFLQDISSFEEKQVQSVNKIENTRFGTVGKVQVDNIIMEECFKSDELKVVNCVDTMLVDTSECNLEEFFHELSKLSIQTDSVNADDIESFTGTETDETKCVPSERKRTYTYADPRLGFPSNIQSEEVIDDQKHQSVSLVEDHSLANESIEECNIIDNTADLEESNQIMQKVKSVFKLVPLCKSKTGHKFNSANTLPSVICENNMSITGCDNTRNRSTRENAKTLMYNTTATTTEKVKNIPGKKEYKCVYNERHFVNSSADLFEISWEHEHNASLILTIKTPSFSSSPDREKDSLNEFLVCDTPLGTSTPLLNKCIILESQDSSEINDCDVSNNLADVDERERKVRFDKRLRRVSSCHVMDIRMKLNESPFSRIQILPKPCLKKSLKSTNLKQNSADEDILSIVMENITAETLHGITYRKDDNHDNNDDENNMHTSACLDASFDLFAESFVIPEKQTDSPKEHLIIPVKQTDAPKHIEITLKKTNTLSEQECKNIETTESSIIGGIKGAVTRDIVKMKLIQDVSSTCSLDVWLDETSALCDLDAVSHHIIENESFEKCDEKPANNRQSLKNDKNENQKTFLHDSLGITDAATPDLFCSQEDPLNQKAIVANRSDVEKCSAANCFSNRIPFQNNKQASECRQRHVLKCFMIDTPNCDKGIMPIRSKVAFKSHNQSLHAAENVENLETSKEMKETIYAEYSPDLFDDSPDDVHVARQPVCDSKTVPNLSNVLCKKLFF